MKYLYLLITFLFYIITINTTSGQFQKRSKHISAADGLCTNDVNYIYQDSQGIIWIATMAGLSKYDGYTIKNFFHRRNDSTSLGSNSIFHIFEDGNNKLWIGSKRSIAMFDRVSEQFTNYTVNNSPLIHNYLSGMNKDSKGNIWVCSGTGFNKYDYTTNKLLAIPLHEQTSLYNINIFQGLTIDDADNIWAGTESHGFFYYNPTTKAFIHFSKGTGSATWLLSDSIYAIHHNKREHLWISYRNGGMTKYSLKSKTAEHFQTDKILVTSISESSDGTIYASSNGAGFYTYSNNRLQQYTKENADLFNEKVRSICIDHQNSIWLTYRHGGVSKFEAEQSNIKTFTYNDGKQLPYNLINDIVVDRQGGKWIGNDKGGVLYYKDGVLKNVSQTIKELQTTVICLFEDSENTIWIGTYKDGLFRYSPNTFKLESFKPIVGDSSSLSGHDIRDIDEDDNGNIWIALHGAGFAKYSLKNKTITNYHFQDTSKLIQNGEWSYSIKADADTVWVGSTIGLYKYNQKTDKGLFYRTQSNDTNSLSSNDVYSIFKDSRGNLWIGTQVGLNRWNPKAESFTAYYQADGLPDNNISSIIEDNTGNLWLGTGRGLCKFNTHTNSFKTYTVKDGLQGNEFGRNASSKASDGTLYFGGFNGFSWFRPSKMRQNTVPPIVSISEVSLFNKPIQEVIGIDNTKQMFETNHFVLNHNQNSIGFEFLAINYINTEENQYAYKLVDVNEDWVYCGSDRKIQYSNLLHGEYTFMLKAANNDGVWSTEVAQLTITILPPFWLQWYAYIVYIGFIFLLLFLFRKYSLISVVKKNDILMQHLEQQKIKDIHQAKLQFFTDVSHEIRTPLTLIVDPLNRLVNQWQGDEKTKDQLLLIQKNSNRILNLTNQLLDFRKVETGNEILQCSKVDLQDIISDGVSTFEDYCQQKKIDLQFQTPEQIHCYVDVEKLKKVITNLISNAIKFTPENGSITVSTAISKDTSKSFPEGWCSISVTDTGIGIAKSGIQSIFGRYKQTADTKGGTGIGLALAKHLTELHHGQLQVSSKQGEGSTFSVVLPLGNKHLKKNEIITETSTIETNITVSKSSESLSFIPNRSSEDKPIVLLVEDDTEILKYFTEILMEHYNIITASNGKDGYEMCCNNVPDLIISDVQMPEMDGNTMTKMLKENVSTSHIPIILLTARNANDQQLESMQTGANIYLTKPIDTNILKQQIENSLASQNNQRQFFKKQLSQETEVPEKYKVEYTFINKAQKLIEEQLSNAQLSVQELANDMGMSRTQLFRKFKAILNQTPKEYIQSTRLNYAKKLLETTDLTVKEVTYQVGFSDPRYFSRCFSKEFGFVPSKVEKKS